MIFRRARPKAAVDGAGDAAVDAAVVAARASSFSDSGTLVRIIEDAALARIDPAAARRVRDVDQSFDRRFAELGRDYERRLDALETEPAERPVSSAADVMGMLAALTGSAVLLAGGSGGPALPLGAASLTAVSLTIFATAAHSMALLLAGRPGRAVSHGWSLTVASALGAIASAAWIGVRTSTVDQGLDGAPVILILGASAAVLFVCSAVAGRAALRGRRGGATTLQRQRALAEEFAPALAEARADALRRAEVIRVSLRPDSLARLDGAVRAGVRELKKKEIYEGATFAEPLSAPRFSSRYDRRL